MQLPPNFIYDVWSVTCNLWSAKQTCLTSWPEIYFRKTLYFFLVSRQNIDLKTSKHEFTDRTHQNKQGFEGKKLRGTDQNTCATPAMAYSANYNLLFSYLDFRVCSACYPPESFKIICLTYIWLKFVDASFHSSRSYFPHWTDIF